MPLPTDLTPLDVAYKGTVFCYTVAKTSIDPTALDIAFAGIVYATNPAVVAPYSDTINTLDKIDNGFPFTFTADVSTMDLLTMDFVANGLPFVTNPVSTDLVFSPLANVVTISAPSASANGLLRKFPLVRNEFVSSNNEAAHVFPYVTIQDPALLP